MLASLTHNAAFGPTALAICPDTPSSDRKYTILKFHAGFSNEVAITKGTMNCCRNYYDRAVVKNWSEHSSSNNSERGRVYHYHPSQLRLPILLAGLSTLLALTAISLLAFSSGAFGLCTSDSTGGTREIGKRVTPDESGDKSIFVHKCMFTFPRFTKPTNIC